MLPDDQWRVDGADGQGGCAHSADEFRGAEEGAGRVGEAVQVEAGRDGEVEGMVPRLWSFGRRRD